MANWSHASLMVLMVLMFIGGGPGSCAGGIKIVTCLLYTSPARCRKVKRIRQSLRDEAVNSSPGKRRW